MDSTKGGLVLRLSSFTAFSALFVFTWVTTAAAPATARSARSTAARRAAATAAPAKVVPDPRPAQARKACAAGNVERGIEILAEIVVENGDANAVYNQGRCYQQNGRPEAAVNRFREYLRTATALSPADRVQVEGYIKELDAEIEVKARRQAAAAGNAPAAAPAQSPAPETPIPTPVAAAPAKAFVAAPAAEPEPAAAPLTATASPAGAPSHPRQTAAIAAASLGVASVAAGVYFGWRTARSKQQIETSTGPLEFSQLESMMAKGRQNAALQWAGYGLGAASLAAAAALFYWDRSQGEPHGESAQLGAERRPARFIILPTVQSGAAGDVAAGALVHSPF